MNMSSLQIIWREIETLHFQIAAVAFLLAVLAIACLYAFSRFFALLASMQSAAIKLERQVSLLTILATTPQEQEENTKEVM